MIPASSGPRVAGFQSASLLWKTSRMPGSREERGYGGPFPVPLKLRLLKDQLDGKILWRLKDRRYPCDEGHELGIRK